MIKLFTVYAYVPEDDTELGVHLDISKEMTEEFEDNDEEMRQAIRNVVRTILDGVDDVEMDGPPVKVNM